MRIYLFLIVTFLVFLSCQNEQDKVVQWIDETSNENVLYEFDTSGISPTVSKTYSREIIDEKSNKYVLTWRLEFVLLKEKGKEKIFLAPLKISSFPDSYNDNFKLPNYPLHHLDYDLQVVLSPNENYHYLISLCEIFAVENPKRNSKQFSKISPRTLQKLLFNSMDIDTTLIEFHKERWFSDIPSNCIWCKQVKVVPLDTMLIVSEITQDSLPTYFDEFNTIIIKESGDYLDTLRFRKEDLMRYNRKYL